MPLYEMTDQALVERQATTFADLGVRERTDLQRLLRDNIAVLGEDLRVVSEEFGEWADARRRIDLLALDPTGHIVVVELKRDSGTHMELQALRYAAMVSAMTFEQVAAAYSKYLDHRSNPQHLDAVADLLEFLDYDGEGDPALSSDVRIVLVAAAFNREITTTVLWLNRLEGMDIRCVRLLPYSLGGKTFLDVEQVVPLAEAADYQVQVRRKEAQRERNVRIQNRDFTEYQIVVKGEPGKPLKKRQAVLRMVQALHQQGVPMDEVAHVLQPRRMRRLPGALTQLADIHEAMTADGVQGDLTRWFDDAAIISRNSTYVVYRMWATDSEPALASLRDAFPDAKVTFNAIEARP